MAAHDAQPPSPPLEQEAESEARSASVRGAAAPESAASESAASEPAAAFAPAFAFFPPFLENSPRTFCTSGTGHIHPQNARANRMMSSTMIASEMTARGTIILDASMVPSAPSGQRMEMSQNPGADMVPMPRFVTNPTATTTTTAVATRVRSVFDFIFIKAPYPSTSSSGWTTIARAVAPSEMDPFCSDTHTLSHAPHPLHVSVRTTGRLFSSSSMASYGQAS